MDTLEKLLTDKIFIGAVGGALGILFKQLGSYLNKRLDARVREREAKNDIVPVYLENVKEFMDRQRSENDTLRTKVEQLEGKLAEKEERINLLEDEISELKHQIVILTDEINE